MLNFHGCVYFYSNLLEILKKNSDHKCNSSQCFSIDIFIASPTKTYENISFTSYLSIHRLDLICISQTLLEYSTVLGDINLEIEGYNFVRSDHPFNSKCGGVCIQWKQSLTLKVSNVKYLQECIVFEIKVWRQLCDFILLYYRCPSQPADVFESFQVNLTYLTLYQTITHI